MRTANPAAHRAAFSGLLALFLLVSLALSAGDPRVLAALVAATGLLLFATTRRAAAETLGPFLSPLASTVDLAILFCGMSWTGGTQSPLALLLPVGVALAWTLEGRPAARFYTVLAVLGFAGFAALQGVPTGAPSGLLRLAAVGLAAPGLLAALEAAASRERREQTRAEPAHEAEPPERNRDAEILHDIRSPLSVLRVYSDLIREAAQRGELPDPEHLANLSREIELAQKLAGAKGPEPAEVPAAAAPAADLVEILSSLATAYRLSLGGRLRIEFIAERPQLPVSADPVALQRAFRNVVENAIKYTPEGGEIRIRAGAAGPEAFVVVKDTGIGMTAEERARAFEYAFRGPGAVASGRPGKGIGLAMTKQILESNGGKIALSSESGFGSEVTILLPFHRGAR